MAWGQSKAPSIRSDVRIHGLSHWPLFVLGILLSAFGVLMIYSSSAVMGLQRFGNDFYYVQKQLAFLGLGWILYFVMAQIPWAKLVAYRQAFLLLGFGLLVIVLVPGLGLRAGGAQRWINVGFGQFQPSELARLLLVFYLAATLTVKWEKLKSFNRGFLPLLVITGAMMLLLLVQPDFGGAMSVLLMSVVLWFIGGVPLSYLAGLLILTFPAVFLLILQAGYRAKRVMTFMNPWADPQGNGFQVIQSYLAFYQGGWTGVGLGNSQQKLFYLPEAHTDFIFSVLGEELGVIGVFGAVILFVLLLVCGRRVAMLQESRFGYLMAFGVTVFLVLPAMLNMMVTLGLLPTKGLPLPFFSSGGSSLLVSLMALGTLQGLYARRDEYDLTYGKR